jgi:biotin carboxyl carrier protein
LKFTFHIDGAVREVRAHASGEVTVDGAGATVNVEAPAADRRVVEVNGKTYDVRVVESRCDTGEFLLELGGERILVRVGDVAKEAPPKKRESVAAAASVAEKAPAVAATPGSPVEVKNGVYAPMPGKIVRVLVKTGQEVKEGDPVVVLEAMKMENELRSPVTGVVRAVHVAEGDQAGPNQLLIEFA